MSLLEVGSGISSFNREQVDRRQEEEEEEEQQQVVEGARASIKYRYRTHPAILANIPLAHVGSQGLIGSQGPEFAACAENIGSHRLVIERSDGITGSLPGLPAIERSRCVWSSLADVFRCPNNRQTLDDALAGACENIDHQIGVSAANRWWLSSPRLMEEDPFAIRVPSDQELGASAEPHHDQDKMQRLVDELDRLADEYLNADDKLNLSYYLNEFETNSCDLSELLATLMQNLLTKLPNPMIKYKLLSLIKQIYIEPTMHINPLGAASPSASNNQALASSNQKHQLDLRLFEAMTQRYLLASNSLICNNAPPNAANPTELQRKRRRQRRAAELKLFNTSTTADNNNKGERPSLRNLGVQRTDFHGPQVNGSLVCRSNSIATEQDGNEGDGVRTGDEISALVDRFTQPANGYRSRKPNNPTSRSSTNSSGRSSSSISISIGGSNHRQRQIGTSDAAGSGPRSCTSRGPMELENQFEVGSSPASYRRYLHDSRSYAREERHLHQPPQLPGIAQQCLHYNHHLEPPAIKNTNNENEAYCTPPESILGNQVPSDRCFSLDKSRPAVVRAQSEYCYDNRGAGDLLVASGQVGPDVSRAFCPATTTRRGDEITDGRWRRGANESLGPIGLYHQAATNEPHLFTALGARRIPPFDEANDELSTCASWPPLNYQLNNGGPFTGQLEFHRAAGIAGDCCCCIKNNHNNYQDSLCQSNGRVALFEPPTQGHNSVTSELQNGLHVAGQQPHGQQSNIVTSLASAPIVGQPLHNRRGQQHQKRHRRRPMETASTSASPHRHLYQKKPIQLRDYPAVSRSQDNSDGESDQPDFSLFPSQVGGRLPASVAQQMNEQANNFVHQFEAPTSRSSMPRRKPNLQVRRTLRVKIKKSKPILGIAIEGGFNVSGQLLPRIVCVHEDGAAYQCGKLRASDLILEVNGKSTVNMTHDEIAKTIANAYYQDPRTHIEFLIGESIHV